MQVLTVTDADYALAADLGLFLVRQAETDRDRKEAADPRAARKPETWIVRSVLTKRPIGQLRFTPVDTLYATKLTAGISGIEESIADALRWMAPVVRHVRTGKYEGTETIARRSGSMIERPRALTECGAKATAADYNPVAAQSELINGQSHEMCPACRGKLEARGTKNLSHLPERRASATVRQRDYIRRLLDEGARNGRAHLLDARSVDQMSSREASAMIDRLKALTLDEPANRGKPGSWSGWLHSYNGYGKARKRRRIRKLMKAYGRRVQRRARKGSDL